jgi:hypothetical protein
MVKGFDESLKPGATVTKGQPLIQLWDSKADREFWLRAPVSGIILSADYREALTGAYVKLSQPLLCITYASHEPGDAASWEIDLKIPQKRIVVLPGK